MLREKFLYRRHLLTLASIFCTLDRREAVHCAGVLFRRRALLSPVEVPQISRARCSILRGGAGHGPRLSAPARRHLPRHETGKRKLCPLMAVVEVVEVEPLRLHDTGDVFLLVGLRSYCAF